MYAVDVRFWVPENRLRWQMPQPKLVDRVGSGDVNAEAGAINSHHIHFVDRDSVVDPQGKRSREQKAKITAKAAMSSRRSPTAYKEVVATTLYRYTGQPLGLQCFSEV